MADDLHAPPLILLSFDGGNHELIEQWAKEGYLPTIAALMERGCWAKTTGPEHIAEHGTFLSLLSGISRQQHGYYYFRQMQSGSYDLQAFSHRDTNLLPFWSHLQGKKVAIIDAPDSNLVPRLPGIQLMQWSVHEAAIQMQPPCAEPATLLSDARRIFGPQISVSEFKANSTLSDDYQMYKQFLRRIEKKGQLCRKLLSNDRFDLVVVGFYEAHTAGHRLWKYRPEVEAENTLLTHAIRDIYQAIDREMGSLLQQLPNEANVFILSCFGIKDQYPTTGLIEAFCRQLGYQTILEATPSLKPLNLARRLLPESWRATIGTYLPLHVQERLLADHFRNSTDWSKTTAFAIPSLYTSFVRVNLRDREPQGIVQRGKEYQMILDRLELDFKQLIDPVTGKPAVERIVRTVDWFNCEPPDSLPDVFVEWQAARYFMQQVLHPRVTLVQEKQMNYHRDSYHSLSGFMVATGPSLRCQNGLSNISILDLAPTFLALMGISVPEEMMGSVLQAIIRD
ncbi:hypothetical protein C7H19_00005 [Aphanothece hegewaldii CCALA 016]|uniref:Type I phosphodiesterase/nucleotide pyrophosphatase n=1 Tax=Aphanothece hegewaldii CCALA 016 TaxID=2107694 RepID=A0A2T1M2Z6_9CHRO|nr:alkaline phosphatase family protein [Aphanothece hegewaldii]PSF39211.1 hypothetical protein C7H19_00005 [Aphanothece hegewaldii CCALA 016]